MEIFHGLKILLFLAEGSNFDHLSSSCNVVW